MIEIPSSYYLAHPLASRARVREWELGFEARTGISLLNPFYDVYRPDIEDLDKGIQNPREKSPAAKVEDDLRMLRGQVGLFCYIDENSTVGVYQEMVYGHLAGKVVHSVITKESLLNHGWLLYHSRKIFRSLDEFELFVRKK